MSAKRARMQNFTILAGVLILLLSAFFISVFMPFRNSIAEQRIELNGAGATFPFPLIDTWRVEYQKIKPEININYQSIGSRSEERRVGKEGRMRRSASAR